MGQGRLVLIPLMLMGSVGQAQCLSCTLFLTSTNLLCPHSRGFSDHRTVLQWQRVRSPSVDSAPDLYLGEYLGNRVISLVAQRVKRLPTIQETRVQYLGREDPLEKEMATHSSTLAWKTPWTEEPGRLQSMGSKESDMTEPLHFTWGEEEGRGCFFHLKVFQASLFVFIGVNKICIPF